MGFEPTTLGSTARCSTAELLSPPSRSTLNIEDSARLVKLATGLLSATCPGKPIPAASGGNLFEYSYDSVQDFKWNLIGPSAILREPVFLMGRIS